MIWMVLYIWEMKIEITSVFWVIGKVQYTRIYSNLNRRNKLWSSGKFNDYDLDDEVYFSHFVVAIITAERLLTY